MGLKRIEKIGTKGIRARSCVVNTDENIREAKLSREKCRTMAVARTWKMELSGKRKIG